MANFATNAIGGKFLAGEITQVKESILRVLCASGNVLVFLWAAYAASNIRTCLGMQIGRTESVNVISRSRIAIAKSCDSYFSSINKKSFGVLISV